ncbi:MAG: sugar phosphate nucleotidyltransferase [Nanoarchaeota archaeon]|nr:sugar phosphate nucleotidyltransferase [Nanoarchaeota archaeon]
MKAVILAGGFGTRLKRVIYDRPKAMASIAGIPFLEHQLRLLKEEGIYEIVLCVSYMSNKIKSYFGDGSKVGINITYSDEEIPLGTGGAIKKAERFLQDTFLVLNGDSYSQIQLKDFIEFHKKNKGHATMALKETKDTGIHGGAVVKEDKIMAFENNPASEKKLGNSGVYLFEPTIFNYIENDKNVSLEKEVFPKLAQEGNLYGYIYDGYFIDIGLPETYQQFKEDVLDSLRLDEQKTIRDAIRKIDKSGINAIVVSDEDKRLKGTLTQDEINRYILKGGHLDEHVHKVMNKEPFVLMEELVNKEEIAKFFKFGIHFIPITDRYGKLKDIEFYESEIESKTFPIVRGRAPLRVSFAGGGTDLQYFFKHHGGAVINATINKYCYGTLIKRADKKIIINTDTTEDILVDSLDNLPYNGKLDLIKAIIHLIKPQFGFELYVHSDLPPGRGLGSSASLAVLIASLFNQIMDTKFNDYEVAEIAYRAEREELNIKGGWQDQYASVTGGFNFMEFGADKSLIYPLRLKKEVIDELQNRLLLCFVGNSRDSGKVHEKQEKSFYQDEKEKIESLLKLKELTYSIREALLTNHLETFGRLLNDTWIIKKKLDSGISNKVVDELYYVGLKNGAYGGRLLGAGAGGYILFFYSPKRRNDLKRALESAGGEVMNFAFDSEGVQVWSSKHVY